MRDRGAWIGNVGVTPTRASVRPRYTGGDLTALLWRERVGMILVFAILLAAGTGLALLLPKTYTAHSSLLVQLGQEYVYEPRAGDAGRGAVPGKDAVVQSESQILLSDELKRRVIKAVGLATVDARLANAWQGADGVERREIEAAAMKILRDGLELGTAPDTSVILLDFKHRNPEAAAKILNTLISQYLTYRKEVFVDVTSPALRRQREVIEGQLDVADDAYEAFLRSSGVADFPTEKAALAASYQATLADKLQTEAQLSEAEGKAARLRTGMVAAPAEITIQRDLDLSAQSKLLKLRQDREDLLSRYTPEAEPVKDIDVQIAQLQALLVSGQGITEKDRRLGANPVHQDLETQRIGLDATVSALRERLSRQASQLAELGRRQIRLTQIESEFQGLSGNRDALQTSVRAFTAREIENRAARGMAEGADDSIRVVEKAAPPAEGKSLRKPVFVLAVLFALFSALCWGLIRVFSRRGFATPGSAARTLDLPILAVAPLKA